MRTAITKSLAKSFQPARRSAERLAASLQIAQPKGGRPVRASLIPARIARMAATVGWRMSRNANGPSMRPIRSSQVRTNICSMSLSPVSPTRGALSDYVSSISELRYSLSYSQVALYKILYFSPCQSPFRRFGNSRCEIMRHTLIKIQLHRLSGSIKPDRGE